jgi:hypothetical protein
MVTVTMDMIPPSHVGVYISVESQQQRCCCCKEHASQLVSPTSAETPDSVSCFFCSAIRVVA